MKQITKKQFDEMLSIIISELTKKEADNNAPYTAMATMIMGAKIGALIGACLFEDDEKIEIIKE